MGSDAMFDALKGTRFDLLCLHGAVVGNHKAPDFDVIDALGQNTKNLAEILPIFENQGGKAVVATGTYFEADEGIGSEPREAFSPYALSKTLTWETIRYHCHRAKIPLAKFVVANPFGPLEKGGFTQYLTQSWKRGEEVTVRTPDYVRDNVPVDLMALHYLELCEILFESPPADQCIATAPSWFAASQGEFTQYFAEKFNEVTGMTAPFQCARQTDFSEPLDRRNQGRPDKLRSHTWDENRFWQMYF